MEHHADQCQIHLSRCQASQQCQKDRVGLGLVQALDQQQLAEKPVGQKLASHLPAKEV